MDPRDHTELGYYVFPLRSGDKKPLTDHGFKDATRDERQILQWQDRHAGCNWGIACEKSGITVIDFDPRHGVDPREAIPGLGLEHAPCVRTGEAPDPDDEFPNSIAGVRGAHVYLRGVIRGFGQSKSTTRGVDVKSIGGYVVAPGSRHPSGVAYEGRLPPVDALPPVPDSVTRLRREDARNGAAPAVGERIAHGEQHDTLVSLAGTMRRRGMNENAIFAALAEVNAEQCEIPGPAENIRQIAASMMRYDPKDVPWNGNGNQPDKAGELFVTVQGDLDLIRAPRFAFEDRILMGAWNVLVGAGGVGKGMLVAWLVAGWTRGGLPGCFQGEPIDVLIVADEDSRHDTWDPRIDAAGGDLARVHHLSYAPGTKAEQRAPFEFNRHVARLERLMLEQNIMGVYFDQVLDHFSPDANGNLPMDVRKQLQQVRAMLREIDRFGLFTAHPNKGHGKSLRDLVGGSHQFVEVARCGLFIGYPEGETAERALVRAKGNVGEPPAPLRFEIEPVRARNPRTGESVPTARVANVREDVEGLTLAGLSVDPVTRRDTGPTKQEQAMAVILELAADGKKHPRATAQGQCERFGISDGTFRAAFEQLKTTRQITSEASGRGSAITYWLSNGDDE